LAVTLAGTVVAAAQPSSALMAMATNVLGRVVQITVAGGSTGYGFVVGEHVDAAGRPVFLIVTADHVVRDQNAQGDQPAPPQVTYCADPTHGWQASLLGFRMPQASGDLAVLEAPIPPGLSVRPAVMAPSFTQPTGKEALNIGLPWGCLTPVVPGQYIGPRDAIWLGFAGLTTPPGSSGGPIVTTDGLIGMVVQDGGPYQPSRALPIEAIAGHVKSWGLHWDIGEDPLVSNVRSAQPYVSGRPAAQPAAELSVSSSAAALTGATISFGAGFLPGDHLLFNAPQAITGSYSNASGRLTLSGTASVDDYQIALRSITYRFDGMDATNGGNRKELTLTWTVRNAAREGPPAFTIIALEPPPPPLNIASSSKPAAYNSGAPPVAIDPDLTVNPATETLRTATVSIGAGFLAGDTLGFSARAGIKGRYDPNTGRLTLSGDASAGEYQLALRSVTYGFSGPDATAGKTDNERMVTWLVRSDREASAIARIGVVPPPPPSVRVGGTVSYTAGESGVSIAPELQVTSATGSLSEATISLGASLHPLDLLNFPNGNGITGRFDPASGELTLSGKASVGDYQAALRLIAFSMARPASPDPNLADQRKVTWTVRDPAGRSDPAVSTIDVHLPPSPRIWYTSGTAAYTPSRSPVPLAPELVVTSSTGTVDEATVTIVSGFLAGDELNVEPLERVAARYDATTGALTLSGAASAASYQAMLRSIEYRFAASDADDGGTDNHRVISWRARNAGGVSPVASSLVNILPPPTLAISAGNSVSYALGGNAVRIDPLLAVKPSSGTLLGATVSISNYLPGDKLTHGRLQGITANDSDGKLILSGPAPASTYEGVLQSVEFQASAMGAGQRTITWSIQAANAASAQAASAVVFSAMPPRIMVAGQPVRVLPNEPPKTLEPGVSVSASSELTGATVRIAAGFAAGDTLNFAPEAGINGTYDRTNGTLTLSGKAGAAAYQAALRSIAYGPSARGSRTDGGPHQKTISWTVTNGAAVSAPVSTSLFVNQVTCSASVVDNGAALTVTLARQGGDRVSVRASLPMAAQSTPRLTTAGGNYLMFVDGGGAAIARSGPSTVNGLANQRQATFAALSASGQAINATFNLTRLNAAIPEMRSGGC
jgi:hypothetical protein